jgi:two-component system OmpR family sensor kinase
VSLRARLTLGLIILAAIGVVTVDVVNYTSLRNFLLDRADQSLRNANYTVATDLEEIVQQGPPQGSVDAATVRSNIYNAIPGLAGAIPGNCVQVRTPGNAIVGSRCLSQYQQNALPPGPVFPVRIHVPQKGDINGDRVSYITVPASKGGGHYRVQLSLDASMGGYYLLLATPLTGLDSTLHRLLVIELLVSAAVLIGLAVLGLWVVRLGLRPLESIGRTATAIADGDLSQRVEQTNEKTEIGRLGRVLNTMLGQIEAAFQSREAALQAREESELKLRRFVADASHELRTPVAAVRAYAELFSRGAAGHPDDLERAMLGVTQASERMSALVDELFLLAHLDEGRELEREAVDLESVVAESVEVTRALEPERPLTVETRPTLVTGDRSRLRQLVDNLLANVRAHTPPGTPVTVTLEHAGGNAVLSVADSGPGIDAAAVGHVFERFYRADATQASGVAGSGLGLAIVAALADAHGGAASVSSEPGMGATFTITLPLAPAPAPAPPVEAPAPVAEAGRTLRNAGKS